MEEGYLAGLLGEGCGGLAGLGDLVGEAMVLKRVGREEWGRQRLRHLDGRAMEGRRGEVSWEKYLRGGERRLDAGQEVGSLAADGGYVCGGLHDGSIRVWSRSTLELERTLTGHRGAVRALLFVGGRLISGSYDRGIRVWDVASGRCEGVLEGHKDWVASLALCGSRLLSGSNDGTVRVWGMEGEASRWRCERTLDGHVAGVWCMVAWGDRAACGCGDGGIRVWSTETWALERTLQGHEGYVLGMAVSGRRLISSAVDGTMRVWSTETWECVQTVEAYPAGSRQYIRCLAVCGSTLVGGSSGSSSSGEVRVWDLETLRPLHTLVQSAADNDNVMSLVCDGREVWGAVGGQVVVWGRRG
jgi:WD40 repeat protein